MKKTAIIIFMVLMSYVLAEGAVQSFRINGQKYLPLYSVCEKKGIEYIWDTVGKVATLKKNGKSARIRLGSDKMLINGSELKDIGPPLYFYEGSVVIPGSFAGREIDRIFKAKSKTRVQKGKKSTSAHTIKRIVLDPGHGGKDPGAVGRYYKLKEEDINLDIAKRLKGLLSSRGMSVSITRTRDKAVSLSNRAKVANSKDADFFISIHTNSSKSRNLRGFEVYYLSERTDDSARALKAAKSGPIDLENGSLDKYNSDAKAIVYDLHFHENRIVSKDLSEYLIKYAKKNNIYTRRNSLRNARFHVLKNIKTDMPAILVEVGYISNKKDEGFLRTSWYRDKIAKALADGIMAYKGEYERTNGFSR